MDEKTTTPETSTTIAPKLGTPRANRRCRDCNACCTTHAVAAIGKAEGERCAHVTRGHKACSIYADRPAPCGDFKCLWLVGVYSDEDRPDKLGVVIDFDDHPKYGPTFKLFEFHQNAGQRDRVQRIARRMSEVGLVLLFKKGGGQRVVLGGPEPALKKFHQDLSLMVVPNRVDEHAERMAKGAAMGSTITKTRDGYIIVDDPIDASRAATVTAAIKRMSEEGVLVVSPEEKSG